MRIERFTWGKHNPPIFHDDTVDYDPGEPRDPHGRWTTAGGAAEKGMVASALVTSKKSQTGAYARPDVATMLRDPVFANKVIGVFRSGEAYPNFRGGELKGPADQSASVIVDHMKANLNFLYDHASAEDRRGGLVWYDKARDLAAADAKQYGIPLESAVGTYASLSPQKDWDENIYLAHRVLDINATKQSYRWDDGMEKKAASIWKPKDQELVEAVRGKTLGELTDPAEKAVWVRTYDEANSDRSYRAFGEHGLGEVVKTQKGAPAKAAWQSIPMIANAIEAADSHGDAKVISEALGDRHKVRSFYNNILHPHAATGDVTVDTHAVGAALLRPLSSQGDDKVAATAMSGPPKSASLGLVGTYSLYADAYREVAKEHGILPQQLQAIVWVTKRKLFDVSDAKKGEIEKAWERYHAGKASQQETQQAVLDIAHG